MRIGFSDHAVDRYIDRVKPHLDRDLARDELRRLVAVGDVEAELPGWVWDLREQLPDGHRLLELELERIPEDAVLVIADGICFPLQLTQSGYTAMTCLCRAAMPPAARAYRNKHRRAKAQRRRMLGAAHHDRALKKRSKREGRRDRRAA